MSANARFLPWVRAKALGADAIQVRVAGRDLPIPIARYGPGDITGIDATQIRRRDPAPGSLTMPPNLFPSIELGRVDLPWALTPGGPDARGRLQPWLALIVVGAPSGSPLGNVDGAKQPVIEVARAELPVPEELALWVHVQVNADAAITEDAIRGGVARILSPRALAPNTRYLACLVPTFEAGRLAGLGQAVPDARATDPAWTVGPGKVVLPVYDSWFFTTTDSGDLERLARRLRGRDLAATSRPPRLDVGVVSGDVAGKLAPFDGVLRPLGAAANWSGDAVAASAARLRASLERTVGPEPPVVGLPVYGSIAAGSVAIASGWLEDLNLDPRRRASAGLGAQMVRSHQDDLVDEAWRQAGDLQRARREREGAALADFAATRLRVRKIAPLAGAHALVTMAPALARLRDPSSATVAARVATSVLPPPALGATFRRILATKTPPAARRAGQGIRRTLTLQNAAVVSPGALPAAPAKLVTGARVRIDIGALGFPPTGPTGPVVSTHAAAPHAAPVTSTGPVGPAASHGSVGPHGLTVPTDPGPHTPPAWSKITAAQKGMLSTFLPVVTARKPTVVDVVRPKALAWPVPATSSPAATATQRFGTRVALGDGARLGGTGVVATPRFTQPLAAWLDPSFLLAGVDIPPDTAGLLEVNGPFVEALLVGANHELARELLWRGVPLDRRATLLGRFFESQLSAAPRDMTAIAEWSASDRLGAHLAFGERVVLILRSRLVSHLRETAIFLAQAEADGPYRKPGATQRLPVFRGSAGLDTAYFGFDLAPEDLAADLGWYIVIQELAGAVRFGLDESGPTAMSTWNDLAWPAVTLVGGYVAAAQTQVAPAQPDGLVWNTDAGQMAGIVLQRPIRLSIHTSLLLPEKT